MNDSLYEIYRDCDNQTAPGMIELLSDRNESKMACYIKDVRFAEVPTLQGGTHVLTLQILRPGFPSHWEGEGKAARHPLIVFVQGSAWTNPNPYLELPQLSMFAKRGYVVASVIHRPSSEMPFPGCLQDVKAAIRFLRAHADEYGIDKERVAIWGTSSGGNLALLTGVTGGMPEFDVGDNLGESSGVQAVVDFFGPSDLPVMMRGFKDFEPAKVPADNVISMLIGGLEGDYVSRLRDVSPTKYLAAAGDKLLPPHLLIHGDCDDVVPFSQSVLYYNMLRESGHLARICKVKGAAHEHRFWSEQVLDEVAAFLKAFI